MVDFVSLEETPDYWAEKVFNDTDDKNRQNRKDEIVDIGYDIKNNAKLLEDFNIHEFELDGNL